MSSFERQSFEVGNGTYTSKTTDTVLVGLLLTNISAAQITATVKIGASGSTKEIIKDVPIPAGSALSALDGKLVLNANDTVEATASASSACIIHISQLQVT